MTLTGTGFTGASAVDFGTVAATMRHRELDHQITATSPAGTGTVDVTVTTPAGTSPPRAADQFTYTAAAPTVTGRQPHLGAGRRRDQRDDHRHRLHRRHRRRLRPQRRHRRHRRELDHHHGHLPGRHRHRRRHRHHPGRHRATGAADQFTYTSGSAANCSASTSGETQLNESAFTGSSTSSPDNGTQIPISNVLNGHSTGRFSTGEAQVPGLNHPVNMGSAQTFDEVSLNAPDYSGDYPRGINVNVSTDGANWTTVASCSPTAYPVTVSFPTQTDQYIQVVLTASVSPNWWSLEFFYVYNASSTTAPTVTGVSPASGPNGSPVTLSGATFTGATAVNFGTNPATFTVNSDNIITAVAPAGTGTVDVTVTTPEGTSATSAADQFTYTPAPIVTSIGPTSGPAAGGTTVTLTGTAFSGASAGRLRHHRGQLHRQKRHPHHGHVPGRLGHGGRHRHHPDGGHQRHQRGGQIHLHCPAHRDRDQRRPRARRRRDLGDRDRHQLHGRYRRRLRRQRRLGVTVVSSTSITATSPAGSGTVDVTVTTPTGGTSATSAADKFTYIAAPTVTSIGPTSGPAAGGTSVTLTGTAFSGATAVNFGTAGATFTVNSATNITATSPLGAGTVDVTVTTPAGTSTTSAADQFTYTGASSYNCSASTSGETQLNESAFTGSSTTSGANGTQYPISNVLNGSTGRFTTGQARPRDELHAQHGLGPTFDEVSLNAPDFSGDYPRGINVNVSTDGANWATVASCSLTAYPVTVSFPTQTDQYIQVVLTASVSPNWWSLEFFYVYNAPLQSAPTVTGVTPASGPNGALVTLTGTAFTGATAVNFGTKPATFTVNSDNIITATAPAGTGTVDVTVTTPEGTSATSSADQFTYISGSGALHDPLAGVRGLAAERLGAAQYDRLARQPAADLGATGRRDRPFTQRGPRCRDHCQLRRLHRFGLGGRRAHLHPRRRQRHPTHGPRCQRRRSRGTRG